MPTSKWYPTYEAKVVNICLITLTKNQIITKNVAINVIYIIPFIIPWHMTIISFLFGNGYI